MDLSNKEESKFWFRQARDVEDKELRKIAMRACDHYHRLALNQEKIALKRMKPGYGFRPHLGFFCVAALLALWCLLAFADAFSIKALLAAGGVLIALMIVGSSFAAHSTGRLSDDSLIKLVRLGIQRVLPSGPQPQSIPTIQGGAASDTGEKSALPKPKGDLTLPPRIDFDED